MQRNLTKRWNEKNFGDEEEVYILSSLISLEEIQSVVKTLWKKKTPELNGFSGDVKQNYGWCNTNSIQTSPVNCRGKNIS